jgi:hypothetical protein
MAKSVLLKTSIISTFRVLNILFFITCLRPSVGNSSAGFLLVNNKILFPISKTNIWAVKLTFENVFMPPTTNAEHTQDNYNANSWANIRKPRHALKLVDIQKWIGLTQTSNISTPCQ